MSLIVGLLCVAVLPLELEALQEYKSERVERREKVRGTRESSDDETGRVINWRKLNLSREQEEQVKSLRREFQIATASIRKELAFAEKDLQAAIRQESVDREKIERLVMDISSLKQRLSEAATENLLALKGILSQEQRETLAASQQSLPEELRALQLTGDQRTRIQNALKSSIRENRKLSIELRELKGDLRDLLLSLDDPAPTQLKALQTQIATQELALERAQVDNLLEIRSILSPEQLNLLGKGKGVE